LAKPGFDSAGATIRWALAGFSNSSVWLIFGAFMFAQGYEETGLGRRIALLLMRAMGRRTLSLGYAVVATEVLLAPFIPSNTARTGGTIYPIIRNLPPLYESQPNDPSARRIGSYLMWTSLSACCVSSSLFLTAYAPNLLALEILKRTASVDIGWVQWFLAFAPMGILLLLVLPAVIYLVYPPGIKAGEEAPRWASQELDKMGSFSLREALFGGLVLLALALWIFAASALNATTSALVVISLMLLCRVVTWQGILGNKQAWSTLVWFATLVNLADGLAQVGFVKWLAAIVGAQMTGLAPIGAAVLLVTFFYFSHYMFANVTAHTTAMLPVTMAVGMAIPGMPVHALALMLVLSLGLMGVLTPYGTGPSPIFYGSGYLPARDYWRLGAMFGLLYFIVFIAIGVPYLFFVAT
jgi:L-tartrate/succinate antiporter